ncbi:unnamed protein product [Mytilus edulis]|uniref:Uncharacterized protein n=1 Tax=Mytilus edulis TaxID=6550 RepID=A0A8S3RSI4_MYTED|nr:unnamed protein product [Mytilus edulis]
MKATIILAVVVLATMCGSGQAGGYSVTNSCYSKGGYCTHYTCDYKGYICDSTTKYSDCPNIKCCLPDPHYVKPKPIARSYNPTKVYNTNPVYNNKGYCSNYDSCRAGYYFYSKSAYNCNSYKGCCIPRDPHGQGFCAEYGSCPAEYYFCNNKGYYYYDTSRYVDCHGYKGCCLPSKCYYISR